MPSLPPQGGSLASGSGIAAALELCAECAQGERAAIHQPCMQHSPIVLCTTSHHAYVPAALEPCATCGKEAMALIHCCAFLLAGKHCGEGHHAYVTAQPATRPPDGTCEGCGGRAWKPLLYCWACYPKRVARAMLRQRAEQAEEWGHAEDCGSHIHGMYNCTCGLFNYRMEAKGAAR